MQKTGIVVMLVLAATAAFVLLSAQEGATTEQLFNEWRQQHGLMLDLSEQDLLYRLKVFEKNLQIINDHNSKPNQSFKMGINKFTGYTQE